MGIVPQSESPAQFNLDFESVQTESEPALLSMADVIVKYAPELAGLDSEQIKTIITEQGITDALVHVYPKNTYNNGTKIDLNLSALVSAASEAGDKKALQVLRSTLDHIIEPLSGAERKSMQRLRQHLFTELNAETN